MEVGCKYVHFAEALISSAGKLLSKDLQIEKRDSYSNVSNIHIVRKPSSSSFGIFIFSTGLDMGRSPDIPNVSYLCSGRYVIKINILPGKEGGFIGK